MDTKIIGQGYNLTADSSLAKELIQQFDCGRYDSFTCLVAFAGYAGISALTPYILREKKRGVKIKIILGIDQGGTSKEALDEVLSWGIDSSIYHTASVNIFHPKIYLFENTDIFTLIVGSNNLTEMGLVKNIECSLMIKDIKSNPIHREFYLYWKSILDGTEINQYAITPSLIDKLVADGIVPTESQRAQRHDNSIDPTDNASRFTSFNNAPVQKNPKGFSPKRRVVNIKHDSTPPIQLPVQHDDALIAEIGGGPRWKQVNFPLEIFENFFGAKRGDNSYSIELQNIGLDGQLGDVEVRQAVTVKSHNYRFEIHCNETEGTYPGNNARPIVIFIKQDDSRFLYQVLLRSHPAYQKIKNYLYQESNVRRKTELRRHIVHIEAIHALYPEFII